MTGVRVFVLLWAAQTWTSALEGGRRNYFDALLFMASIPTRLLGLVLGRVV